LAAAWRLGEPGFHHTIDVGAVGLWVLAVHPLPVQTDAKLVRRAGQPRDAAAAEQKAARLLARCEGAATPSVQSITARVRLTPGELDAAVQAAAGRSNKQIASDMQLSVRTVESHLQRAYDKLGVSGRHELADALREQPTA
jgi:DNA-binding CsgD family transcriptional regulator